jgi:hypothetical protein
MSAHHLKTRIRPFPETQRMALPRHESKIGAEAVPQEQNGEKEKVEDENVTKMMRKQGEKRSGREKVLRN